MAHASALPAPRTALLGRTDDLRAVGELIAARVPLVTIVGTGGMGKTRLAVALAHASVDAFDDQVWFVPLAGITEPTDVPAAIAGVIHVRASANRSIGDAVCDMLRHRSSLLVLDNFEQILDGAPFVSHLVEQCPLLTVVVTSRAPLHIVAERVYELESLPVSSIDAPGVQLFGERARAVQPTFELDARNEASVLALCARLDGLPLAIELAASRIPLLSPAELLDRFDRSADAALRLLAGNARDVPARHRSLENTIRWSYELLDGAGQTLLCDLAVFEGGATMAAIEAVCAPAASTEDPAGVVDVLSSLVDLRLVAVDRAAESRYRMLETIREFALVRLAEDPGRQAAVLARHADHFRSVALSARDLLEGPADGRWIARLEADYLNLRAALDELDRRGDPQAALDAVSALGWFWRHSGRGVEGRARLSALYERCADLSLAPEVEANALVILGRLSADSGLIGIGRRGADETIACLERGLELHRAIGEPVGLIRALESMVTALVQHEHGDRAEQLCREALDLCGDTGHWWWHAMMLYSAVIVGQMTGDLDDALAAALQGRTIASAHADSRLAAIGTLLMGTTYMFAARHEEAASTLKEAYHASLAEGDKRNAAFAAVTLGPVYWQLDDLPAAARWTHDGMLLAQAVSEWRGIGLGMTAMTYVAEFSGLHDDAARLYGVMSVDHESFLRALPPRERHRIDGLARRIRRHLDDGTFERLVAFGAGLSSRLAIDEALRTAATVFDAAPSGAAAGSVPHQLSQREIDVLVLVATGLTNQHIGERLHLSVGTIERHLVNLYRKIGVRRRTEATAYAIRHGLVAAD